MLKGFEPVYSVEARLLILGSFPGVASLNEARYYAHPRNQFWIILGALLEVELTSLGYEARLDAVKTAGIAIWDVLQSCIREGSLDSSIRAPRANPLLELMDKLPRLQAVAFNGKTAAAQRGLLEGKGLRIFELPSSSPAYASRSLQQKLIEWSVIKEVLV